ncbi:DUF1501 domain-containing protein [Blastopirellula marina]|uniref:DUF1501 domain-containing protein n=1 Tax=Blastopirellula marina TaxID=124 RepID=A0A2S8F0F0_9BACT|nr:MULTISPECIES: DUF1501 domain-containing protein [Pirellulaceae]PQO25617.1 DUF1501 domain-containing protein [Blastopirellula marina]RCS43300.1 DUF1501 domain-containing protein [Bremerella cremea]
MTRTTYHTDRRAFLVASATGLAGLHFGMPGRVTASDQLSRATQNRGGGKAKSVILFFLCGGASHIDTWDLKPQAPAEYRGPFKPISTSAPGMQISEHLPQLAKQAHHLAVIRSVCGTVNTNDHHAGYYYNLTGHVPDVTFKTLGNDRRPYADDWPFMGSVVASRRTSPNGLPSAITLPHKPSRLPYTRPGQFAARLGVEFDPLYVNGSVQEPLKFQVPSLMLAGDVTPAQLQSRQELLQTLDVARSEFEHSPVERIWKRHQKRTLDLLLSSQTSKMFDVESEPESIRARYGPTVNSTSLLLARRMVEAGIPFITVFWKENEAIKNKCRSGGGWDTHGNNFDCLKQNLLPEFDQAFSALIEDLEQRNLLDQTLLIVNSEMGRTPKIGDPRSGGVKGAGRDHWTHCQSVLMAGGGIQGGHAFGSSDKLGEFPAEHPLTPADIAKTVYFATGIDTLQANDQQGRPYNLLEEGHAIEQLF